MPSNAEAFFHDFVDVPEGQRFTYLSALVSSTPPTQETEWLDFKGNPDPKDILKTWSEAVSGFANTEGGVLVWGIDCRKSAEGIDAAGSLSLIPDPLPFKSKLQTNVNQTTDPPVQGIRIEAVAGLDGKGFVVCLIPESKNKPHRAEQQKNKPYIIRAGESFVVMNPSLLRSMFHPRVSPELSFKIVPAWEPRTFEGSAPKDDEFTFLGLVTNSGRSTAHDLVVEIQADVIGKLETATFDWEKVETLRGLNGLAFKRPLHPTMIAKCFSFDARLHVSPDGYGRLDPYQEILFLGKAYARDMEPIDFYVQFSRNEVADRIQKAATIGRIDDAPRSTGFPLRRKPDHHA